MLRSALLLLPFYGKRITNKKKKKKKKKKKMGISQMGFRRWFNLWPKDYSLRPWENLNNMLRLPPPFADSRLTMGFRR